MNGALIYEEVKCHEYIEKAHWGIGMHRSTPRNIPVTRRSPTAARALCAAKDVLIRDTALSAGKEKIPVCGHG